MKCNYIGYYSVTDCYLLVDSVSIQNQYLSINIY